MKVTETSIEITMSEIRQGIALPLSTPITLSATTPSEICIPNAVYAGYRVEYYDGKKMRRRFDGRTVEDYEKARAFANAEYKAGHNVSEFYRLFKVVDSDGKEIWIHVSIGSANGHKDSQAAKTPTSTPKKATKTKTNAPKKAPVEKKSAPVVVPVAASSDLEARIEALENNLTALTSAVTLIAQTLQEMNQKSEKKPRAKKSAPVVEESKQ